MALDFPSDSEPCAQSGQLSVFMHDAHEFRALRVKLAFHALSNAASGKRRRSSQDKNGIVFRTLELPVDVEPSAVTGKRNGPILEICFPKVRVKAVGQSG